MKPSPLNSINEAFLLQQLQQKEKGAFERIYKLYSPIMLNHAYRMTGNEDDAKDIVQELFINFYQRKMELTEGTSIGKFLYFTLRNKMISEFRKKNTYTEYLDSFIAFAEQHQHGTLDYIYEKDLRKIIEKEILKMPARMREIFELSRFEYLSYKEIGEKLQLSPKTVKAQIRNALLRIKEQLPQYLIAIATAKVILDLFLKN